MDYNSSVVGRVEFAITRQRDAGKKAVTMEASHLQIYWHDSQPVYTLTFQKGGSSDKLFTAGGDNKVRIWRLNRKGNGKSEDVRKIESMDFLGSLTHHEQAINVIRFNSYGDVLASAGDDGQILLWKQEDPNAQQESVMRPFGVGPEADEADENKEKWVVWKRLRGGSGATAAAEIYDLAWSPDNRSIVVACMDNSIRLFDVGAGTLVCSQSDHGHYVQGVAWDPLNQFILSQSADRSLHVYEIVKSPAGVVAGLKLRNKIVKAELPTPGDVLRTNYLFHNETLPSFFRRCSVSPCGGLVVVPSGVYKVGDDEATNCVYVYTRSGILNGAGGVKNRPALRIPSLKKPALMVAFSPVFYETRQHSVFQLPYKLIFAIATTNEVLLYDTDAWEPLCVVGNIHYSPITDLAWSGDGSTLLVSSTDGFCSYVSIDTETQFGASMEPPALRAEQLEDNYNDVTTGAAAAKTPRESAGIVNMLLPMRKIPGNSNDTKKRRIQPTQVDL
ncbi:CAC2-like protein [Saccharomyces kudriavzevii IFO 1802]|uniref:CAC2-like protein n=2 Tax=Saccharomyces kudriavzevii (strain ATCC MYA-4449 / AS 2.2408 / CBS 8840 / NBRC 1802 / NCYC 2889) TaxID=226230 RepID=J6E9L5_SACK1|nr:CAC2-like protein [Saccharomyces kudriavzevii IFO 1802]